MTKRTRGSANRTAQRRPANRPAATRQPAGRPLNVPLPASRVIAETTIADAVEAPSEAAADVRSIAPVVRSRAKPTGMLAAKAATEYVYVAQDLRRIVAVAAILFGIMFVLWILIEVVRIGG